MKTEQISRNIFAYTIPICKNGLILSKTFQNYLFFTQICHFKKQIKPHFSQGSNPTSSETDKD